MGARAAAKFGSVKGSGAAEIARQGAGESGADESEAATAAALAAAGGVDEILGEDLAGDRERAVMIGGPGDPQGAPAFAFKYGDQEFNTSEDLETYIQNLHTEIGKKKTEVATITTVPVAQPVAVVDTTPKVSPYKAISEEFFTDPENAMAKLVKIAKQEATTELTAQYQADQNMKDFWSGFYKDNPNFVKHKDVIENFILKKHWGEIAPLEMKAASKLLSEKVVGEFALLGVAQAKPVARQRTIIEGSQTARSGEATRPEKTPAATSANPVSISGSLKARQAARRAAALN